MALINKDKLISEVREFQNVPGYVYNAIVTRPEVAGSRWSGYLITASNYSDYQ